MKRREGGKAPVSHLSSHLSYWWSDLPFPSNSTESKTKMGMKSFRIGKQEMIIQVHLASSYSQNRNSPFEPRTMHKKFTIQTMHQVHHIETMHCHFHQIWGCTKFTIQTTLLLHQSSQLAPWRQRLRHRLHWMRSSSFPPIWTSFRFTSFTNFTLGITISH